ncbi:MAG: LysM domain-containing protein, partial [Anaerolineae bacterium]
MVNVTGTAAIKPAGIVAAAALAILLLGARPVFAQRGPAKYTVQVGDTLSHIALKYNVSVAQLAALNGLANPDLIFAGQSLTIPGDSPVANGAGSEHVYTVQPGDTLFEIAARFGVRMTRLARANNIANVDLIEVGQPLTIPPAEAASPPAAPLPFPFKAITLSETRIAQGRTLVVSVTLTTPASLTMEFEDRQFVSTGNGQHYWGIVGVHALSDVGLYSVAVRAILPDGAESGVAQDVAVVNGPYGTETIEVVAGREGLLAPEVIQAEADMLRA